jgi:transposase
MAEDISDLKERLVVGRERGGQRRRFDPQAKRELVQACLQPGVSVAAMALEHGLNANLLRKWISDYTREQSGGVATNRLIEDARPAFVPVVEIGGAETAVREARRAQACIEAGQSSQRSPLPSQLVAELPNGVMLRLECSGDDTTLVTAMIETLGRSHVPVRR